MNPSNTDHLAGGKLATLERELDVQLETLQSNHEGVLIDKMHECIDAVDGALLNPAGLTQHGVPLHDAIKAMPFPMLEIHMSNIAARETWRAHSIISPAVKATIKGLGWRSYTAGLLARRIAAAPWRGGNNSGCWAAHSRFAFGVFSDSRSKSNKVIASPTTH